MIEEVRCQSCAEQLTKLSNRCGAELQLHWQQGRALSVTLCDIAHFKQVNVAGQSLYNLLLVADRALNQAKAQGRNRVVFGKT